MKNKKPTLRKQNINTFRWLSEVTGNRKWQIAGILILRVALGLIGVAYAMLLREMIDAAAGANSDIFVKNAVILVLLIIMQIAFQAAGRYLEENARATLENRLKQRLFSVILKKDYESVTAVHSGEWMNRLTSDTVVVADGLVQILPGAAGMLVKMIAALIMIILLEPKFGGILIPGGILLVLTTAVFRKKMKQLHKKIQETDGKLRMFLQEHIGSLLIVRSFAMEEQSLQESEEKMAQHKKARIKRNHFSNVSNVGFATIMQAVYLFGAIYCSYGIMQGTVTYGTLTAILQLISQVQSPMANITGYVPKYYAMIASAERLMEAEALKDDCPNGTIDIEEIQSYYKTKFAGIRLKDAAFTYLPPAITLEERSKNAMPVVFHGVNLEIQKGDYVAITGQSGCGKSTILKLLMCLYTLDDGARYLLEKDGSQKELTSAWHKLFAYVPQGNQLMSGSIREIIAFSDKTKMQEEEKMQQAIRIACADEFINEMEDGIDTILGERGQGLSEGQMQRIAIARAVFSENPVMILDESTSALDEETEQKVLKNLKEMTDKTVLIVTHRPAALAICNKQVIMFENGTITECRE